MIKYKKNTEIDVEIGMHAVRIAEDFMRKNKLSRTDLSDILNISTSQLSNNNDFKLSLITAVKLAEIPQICGIKEASGNISQIITLCKLLKDKMAVYSGDDSLNYTFLTLGAKGVISVTANVLPKQVKQVVKDCFDGNYDKALVMHEQLLEINKNLFVEVNPIPVKYACSAIKLCCGEIRLPLTELEDKNKDIVKKSLETFGFKF